MLQTMNNPKVVGRLVSRYSGALPYEMGILVVWLSIIFLPNLTGITALRYLAVLYFMSFLVLDAQRVWTGIRRSWIVMPLAIWGTFSMFWSPYPAAAFRVSLLIICSVLVTIVIGCRYSPRQFFKCVVIAGMIVTLYSATFLPTAHLGGPYSSKNYLAVHMLFAYIAFVAAAFDKNTPFLPSMLLLAFAGLAGFIIYQSDAVSSLLLMMGATVVLIAVKWLFVGLSGLRGARTLLFVVGSSIALLGALLFLNYLDPKVVDDFLALFGKDSSLTGRTDLWAAARQIMVDHPIFGVGHEGFWQYDVGAAQTLVENDHKEFGTKLGFHSAYLETGAHLGYVGLGLFIMSVIWATSVITLTFLRQPTLVSGGFFTFMIVCLTSSFTESFLSGALNIPVTLFYGAATMYSVWSEPRAVATLTARQMDNPQGRSIPLSGN